MCETRLLYSGDSVTVSQCVHCRVLFIWHGNILLSFTSEKFSSFRRAINSFGYEVQYQYFADGEERLVVSTPNPEISFAFTAEEWASFKNALNEAAYMQEIYALMV
ncbi:hypothetical protein [Arcticibacter tournemirensis]|uniref:hypothetical protein n=1 Tax=Arcticibacter tournemirensis TaxID=699437 RepID=UPI001F47C249|nr:hypothetical protein [Arcticibacter tournemirensis]